MTTRPLCIVAAAGPGMGVAIARRFAREGFDLALLARNAGSLSTLEQELRQFGGAAHSYAVDLCDVPAVRAAFNTIRERQGATAVLVYNGGSWHEVPAMQMDPVLFSHDLMLCVTGALVCAQAVYPDMKAAGNGTILFTGGGLALYPAYGAGNSSLTAGKSGLRGFTFALAKELAPDGVHVGTVTIAGAVKPGTAFDPDVIAERYWTLHQERTLAPDAWTVETVFDGR